MPVQFQVCPLIRAIPFTPTPILYFEISFFRSFIVQNFSFEVVTQDASVPTYVPQQTRKKSKEEVKKVHRSKKIHRSRKIHRPQHKSQLIQTEPEEDRDKLKYFSFSYFINFHRLFLYRWRLRWRILVGFILFLLLALAVGIPLLIISAFKGEDINEEK